MAGFFSDGGLGMYATLAFGLLLLAVGAMHALRPRSRPSGVFVVLTVVCLASGTLGLTLALVRTFLSAGSTGSQFAATMLGVSQSLHNLILSLVFVVLSTLLFAVGALRAALAAGREPP
jgi:hypothetical protein